MTDAPLAAPRARLAMRAEVRSTRKIGDAMVQVVLGGGDLDGFTPSAFTDSYVKLVFLTPGVDYPQPLDVNGVKSALPAEHWPRLRTYTVRDWDGASKELTLDVIVHGDAGLAGPWARSAQPGDLVHLVGPGGEYAPDPDADWHLFAGDESALPAICVSLAALPSHATAHVFIEVGGPNDEVALHAPAGAVVTWLHRGERPVGQLLEAAVRAFEFPAGTVHAFIHGEAGFVKQLRRLMRIEYGLPRERLSISGYWRYGADDEGWRAAKKAWNQEVEAEEVAAGVL